jgi:hypothetical protein
LDIHRLFPFHYHRDTSYESVIDAQVNKLGNVLFEYLLIFSLTASIFVFLWQCSYCHIVMFHQLLLFINAMFWLHTAVLRYTYIISHVAIFFSLSASSRKKHQLKRRRFNEATYVYDIVTCLLRNATLIRGCCFDTSFYWTFHLAELQLFMYRFITHKPVTCLLVLNCSCRCNCLDCVLGAVPSELSVSHPLKKFLCLLGREHLLQPFNSLSFDKTAGSIYVTAETPLLKFSVVTVYYLRVAA